MAAYEGFNTDRTFPALDSLMASSAPIIGDRGASYLNNAKISENDNLAGAINSASMATSDALTYSMYLNRNKTISDIASKLTDQNSAIQNGSSETYARQGEINEWEAQNKLDTLFFLQWLFLYLTFLTVIIYMWRMGLFPESTFYWIVGISSVILAGILWNRANYTNSHRDNRYWNRRYIALDSSLDVGTSASSCTSS
jgi:hypothetical protein